MTEKEERTKVRTFEDLLMDRIGKCFMAKDQEVEQK